MVFFRQSQSFKLRAAIHHDLFMQDLNLMSEVPLRLRFYKSNDKFTCMADTAADAPRIEVLGISLQMCQVIPEPETDREVQTMLMREPATYPIRSTDVLRFLVQKDSTTATFDNMFPGTKIPDLLVFGLINADAFNGDCGKPPLAFDHCRISTVGLYVNNVPVKKKPLKMNFAGNQTQFEAMEGFMNQFSALNTFGMNDSNDFGYWQFLHQYTIFVFNPSPVDGNPLPRHGVVKLELAFSSALQENTYALIMTKKHGRITVNSNRDIEYGED